MLFCTTHPKLISFLNRSGGVRGVFTSCVVAIVLILSIALSVKVAYSQRSQPIASQRQVERPQTNLIEHQAIVLLRDGTGHIVRNHQIIDLTENKTVLATTRDIIVAQTGTIEVIYFDGQASVIPPRSEVEIVFHDQIGDKQRVVLFQHMGRSITNINRRTSDTSRFEVQTPSSTTLLNISQFAVELSSPENVRYSSNIGKATTCVENQEPLCVENREPLKVEPGYEAMTEEGKKSVVAPMHNTHRTALFTTKVGKSACLDRGVQLMQPQQKNGGEETLDFYGTAMHKEFDYYKLEYTIVGRPANKYSWLYRGDKPVENGLLARINVGRWPAGEYVIRLQVVDKTGNYPDSCSINLEIDRVSSQ